MFVARSRISNMTKQPGQQLKVHVIYMLWHADFQACIVWCCVDTCTQDRMSNKSADGSGAAIRLRKGGVLLHIKKSLDALAMATALSIKPKTSALCAVGYS